MTEQLQLLRVSLPEPAQHRSAFRPIHYLGAKTRLLDEIACAVDQADPSRGRLLDLFSGSGVVSVRFAHERDVVAVDIQEYSRVLSSALLNPRAPAPASANGAITVASELGHVRELQAALQPLFEYEDSALRVALHDPELLCSLLEHGSLGVEEHRGSGRETEPLISALAAVRARIDPPVLAELLPWSIAFHYGGVYFSYRQALDLDVLLAAVDLVPHEAQDTWVAAILSTASELVASVGNQFAQPLRPRTASGAPKPQVVRIVGRQRARDVIPTFSSWLERYRDLPPSSRKHAAVRADYRGYMSAAPSDVSIVYADPPYTRDHYSRFYHVLETMARRDSPGITTMRLAGRTQLSRGIYRADRHQSPFCIKSQAPEAFSLLFAGVRSMNVPLVLSYSPYSEERPSHPRLLTVREVGQLAREYFPSVSVVSVEAASHSKFNAASRNFARATGAEVLITCHP